MKLPVLKAIETTAAYLGAHAATLLKILWLPTLCLLVAQIAITPVYLDAQLALAEFGAESPPAESLAAMGEVLKWTGLLYLVMAVFTPMTIAGILRHLLLGEQPSAPFYLRFKGDELRVLGAYVLVVILGGIAFFVGSLALMAVSLVFHAFSPAVGGLVSAVLTVAFCIAAIWFLLRLSLIFPAAVAEGSLGLAGSWLVTQGNVWRLLGFWLVWSVVLLVLGLGAMLAIGGGEFAMIGEMIAAGGDETAQRAAELKMLQSQREAYDLSRPDFWPRMAVAWLFTVLISAVWIAASGCAWRFLTADE